LAVLRRQFNSPLVYVLAVASALALIIRDFSDASIILIILAINTALGFVQEYRSERTIERLAQLITRRTLVRRAGHPMIADVTSLVPGDVVLLKEGDVVPADIKLLTADRLSVDESLLTGESVPVAKTSVPTRSGPAFAGPQATQGTPRKQPPSSQLSESLTTLCFAGSAIECGVATGVIYATGAATALGQMATLSTRIRKVTQYEQSLQAFSSLLIRIIVLTLALALLAKVLITADFSRLPTLFLFVIALAIAVIPEALPVIATVTLSRGAYDMAREHVVVKRLPSLEDLGNVTLLCTDKTGTLTENRMTVQQTVSDDTSLFQLLACAAILAPTQSTVAPAVGAILPSAAQQQRSAAASASDAFDIALLSSVPPAIQHQASQWSKLQETPFDPAARRRSVVIADPETNKRYLVALGAAETLLDLAACPHAGAYREAITREGAQGLRHLALAYATLPSDSARMASSDLTFLGYVTLSDPLRPSAAQAIELAEELGVTIKILSGDSAEVVGYVGRQIGLLAPDAPVVTGYELAAMTPDELSRTAEQSSVFARVTPEQKYQLIQAMQSHEVVGYQGDGANDAPALKLADVGIAVDTATDVAKANADIILLKKDLGVIVNGIRYGRAIFANVNKYITYTMIGNFGNYFALAALFLLSFTLPLLPRQVLLISLITDLPLVTISTDTVAADEIMRPEKYNTRRLMGISLVLGSLTALFEVAFFATLTGATAVTTQTSLYLFLTITQLIVIISIRNKDHFWKAQRPSFILLFAMSVTGLVAFALPYTGPLASVFSFAPLSALNVARILLMSVVYLLVLDVVKLWYFRLVEGRRVAPQRSTPDTLRRTHETHSDATQSGGSTDRRFSWRIGGLYEPSDGRK